MEICARAMLDCLSDEIVLLNEDIQNDAIMSSIKNLISEEGVEFREDNIINDRTDPGDKNGGGSNSQLLSRSKEKNQVQRNENLPIIEPPGKQKQKVDTERVDFLLARKQRSNQDVPDLIVFEPKRRRRYPNGEENQPVHRVSALKLKNGSHQMKPFATNKQNLKLHRWMKRGKKGLLTTKQTKSADRRLRSGLAEF